MPFGTGAYGTTPYAGGLPSSHTYFAFGGDSLVVTDSARNNLKAAATTDHLIVADQPHSSRITVSTTGTLVASDHPKSANKVAYSTDSLSLSDAVVATTVSPFTSSIINATTFTITPVGYDGLQLNWNIPTGLHNEQILLRSAFGTPLSIYAGDGTVLLDQLTADGPLSTSYLDTDLRPGHFYYYSLLVFNPHLDEYVLAGAAQGLVLTYYGFGDTFQSWTPDWYLELDAWLPSNPLESFLNLLGYEMDWLRSEIESLFLFSNISLVSGALLPALGANYGMSYEPELGMTRSRVLVGNAVFLYKNRGTTIGIEAAASGFSGYGCTVTAGKNLEIQLDDATFDSPYSPNTSEFRHWIAANTNSTIQPVTAASVSVTPQHTTYNPAPILVPELSSPLVSGVSYNNLATTELAQDIAVGDSILLTSNGNSQTYVASAAVTSGNFAIPVTAQNANYSYPIGTTVQDLTSGFITNGYLPVNNENVGEIASNGEIVSFTTCNVSTATTLGIPIPQVNTPTYVLSQYFRPLSGTVRSFFMQIDWYTQQGALIPGSSIGNPVTEVVGEWVQAFVVGVPPAGAYYFGRSFKSTATLSTDTHLTDAEQVEINTQATPGPTPWEPPRDIQINLFPVRQNLFVNPVAQSGTFGWSITGGTLAPTSNPAIPWPAETSSGFAVESEIVSVLAVDGFDEFGGLIPGMAWFGGGAIMGGVESATPQVGNITVSSLMAVNPGLAYSLSVYMMAATVGRTIQLSVGYYDINNNLVSSTVFAATLAAPLVTGQSYNALPISPLPFAVNANETIVINVGGLNSQLVQTSQPSQIGTMSLPVGTFVANANYPAGTVIVFSYITFQDTTGAFTRGSSINLITPVNAVTALAQFTIINPAPFEVHYLAAPLFEPLPSLLPYFDANFQPSGDYFWEGTPNESISDYYPALPAKLSRLVNVLEDYVPIGSTFSLITGAPAFAAVGETG